MNEDEYRSMARYEDSYWWHLGRNAIVDRVLDRFGCVDAQLLNIGCGTGGTIPMLQRRGRVTNVDMSETALAICRERGIDDLVLHDGGDLPFEAQSFDVAAALDVLEHIDDDRSALREWSRVLRPGGMLLVTVPAYQWLWSDHDVALHHQRRYARPALVARLEEAGFRVAYASYAVAFSFPLVVGYRLLSRVRRQEERAASYVAIPKSVNRLFTAILRGESRFLARSSLPFGTSIVAVAYKAEVSP